MRKTSVNIEYPIFTGIDTFNRDVAAEWEWPTDHTVGF